MTIHGVVAVLVGLLLTVGFRRVLDEGLRVTVGRDVTGDERARDALVAMVRTQHVLVVAGVTGLVAPVGLPLSTVAGAVTKGGVILLAAAVVPVVAVFLLPGLGARVPPAATADRPRRVP